VLAVGALLGALGLGACTTDPPPSMTPSPTAPSAGATAPAPTSPVPSSPTSSASTPTAAATVVPEPTTTNTLPPPPPATAPAPSTAGRLTASSLPVPKGWKTVARPGGDEEGYRGNGTWVHARDPRYAARDTITIGCREITRDDYTDPTAALEGSYENADGAPGVGLLLGFADTAAATRWFDLYRAQVEACTTVDDPVRTTIVRTDAVPAETGLADRRRYPDGRWLEVAGRSGTAVTLVILSDPDGRMTDQAAQELLTQIVS